MIYPMERAPTPDELAKYVDTQATADQYTVWMLTSGAQVLLRKDNTVYDFWYGFHRLVAVL